MISIAKRPLFRFLFLVEVLLIVAAEFLSFFVRFEFSSWTLEAYPNLLPKVLIVLLVTQLCFYYNELYQFGRIEPLHKLALRILQAVAGALVALLAIYYFFPQVQIGRGVFLPGMGLIFLLTFLWRSLVQALCRKGNLAKRVLVLGSSPSAIELVKYVLDPEHASYELVGFMEEDFADIGPYARGRAIGTYNNLLETALRERVEAVIVAVEDRRGKLPLQALAELRLQGIEVIDSGRFWEQERGVISVTSLRPSWLIFSDGFRQSRLSFIVKEVFEFLLAAVVMVLALPIMAISALAIRLESAGPVLYRQVRVGARGKVFTLYKFRSMRIDAEIDGKAQWAQDNDPRVTRVGRFLRKYRLDELPQLLNVVRGEMSIVGPRPERPQFVFELEKKIPCYLQRLAVKPGVTGLAQVRHQYGASVEDAAKKLEYDLYYVKNLSIFLDLSILVDTLKVVLVGKGAR